MIHAKFQPNILTCTGKKLISLVLLLFSTGGHLGFSTRLNFHILKPCSLIKPHVKFENHGCSGFRELFYLNGLKC